MEELITFAPTRALRDILAERHKQRRKWGDDHDDDHAKGELAYAAAHLASRDGLGENSDDVPEWALTLSLTIGGDRRRELVIAAALLFAEIERIDRAGGAK